MDVSIEPVEKREGLILKKSFYYVYVTVDFTHEQLAIIKARKLGDTVILERDPPANLKLRPDDPTHLWHLTINKLIKNKPEAHVFASPLEAKIYEEELEDKLRILKSFIEGNAEVGSKRSFTI